MPLERMLIVILLWFMTMCSLPTQLFCTKDMNDSRLMESFERRANSSDMKKGNQQKARIVFTYPPEISWLDFRVGRINDSIRHPRDPEILYVQTIDIGEKTFKTASKKKGNSPTVLHYNCRNNYYKGINNSVLRFPVPDDKVNWEIKWPGYKPANFTDDHIKSEVWADPEIYGNECLIKFNAIDNLLNRISYLGNYSVVESYPLNPMGRTGIRGRGKLGKWGPNHSALAVVTKWKTSKYLDQNNTGIFCKKPIAQFVGVQHRSKTQLHWGFPGGFIDPGESVDKALKREFLEEATNFIKANTTEKEYLLNLIDSSLINGEIIYAGYDDSSRNTDNAWIEVTAKHFHDESNNIYKLFPLVAGDGLLDAKWVDIDRSLVLTSTVKCILKRIISKMDCHW